MTRSDEIAALADELDACARNPGRDSTECAVEGELLRRVAAALRLSATSPGDTVREALEPFLKAARIIENRPQDYGDKRIAAFGGLADAHDLYPRHFMKLLHALAPAEKAGGEADAYLQDAGPAPADSGYLLEWCQKHPLDAAAEIERLRRAAAPTPPSAESICIAICKAKGVSPFALHQNYDDSEPVDGEVGHGRKAHFGWRNQMQFVEPIQDLFQSAAPGGGTKSDGLLEGSLPSGESELLVTAARAPSDPAQEPSVTTFGGSSPCFGRPGDARNTYVDAQEPEAVAYLHRHRKFGRDLQFTQLEACDREQGWTEEPLYRTSLDREAVARIIDPDAFEAWDRAEGSWRKDEAKVRCWPAEEKADAILALIEGRT